MYSVIQPFDNTAMNFIFTSVHSAVYSWLASYFYFNNTVKFLPLVLVICWYWSKKTPQQGLNRQILVETVLNSLLAIIVGRLLALTLPFRARPFLNPELTNIPDPHVLRTWSSFPSDHAVLSFALAASLFRISPTIGILAFLHASIVICLPRVVLGLHYPSDIIGGAILGVLIVIISAKIKAREKLVKFTLDIESKFAEIFYVFAFILLYEIIEMFESIRGVVAKILALLRHIVA